MMSFVIGTGACRTIYCFVLCSSVMENVDECNMPLWMHDRHLQGTMVLCFVSFATVFAFELMDTMFMFDRGVLLNEYI